MPKQTVEINDRTKKRVSVRLDRDSKESWEINLTLDWSGIDGETLQNAAESSYVIAWQRQARNLSPEALDKLKAEGYVVHVENAGKKIVTAEQQLAELKKFIATLPKELQEKALEDLAGVVNHEKVEETETE